jgi:glc operon protein GlcG
MRGGVDAETAARNGSRLGLLSWQFHPMTRCVRPSIAVIVAPRREQAARPESLINIAVVDDGANLVYFEQMDGAFKGSSYISQHKAMTSANFPFPTRIFGELAFGKDGKPGMVPGIADVPGIITFPGGLPIMTANKVQIGGIGVSGGTSDQDEDCAKAGLDAVQNDCKSPPPATAGQVPARPREDRSEPYPAKPSEQRPIPRSSGFRPSPPPRARRPRRRHRHSRPAVST